MCKCTSKPWTEQRTGAWITKDMDGYTMRVSPKKGAWRWSVRPPGGGYDVYSGTEESREIAQQRAEKAYQGLHEEIHKINEERRGSSNS